jgi:hypothetical protein
MPYGQHIATCVHCGKQWVVCDCIEITCPECKKNGHSGMSINCPICKHESDEQRKRIDKAIANNKIKK